MSVALAETIKTGASLIVAKIDRLTRVAYYGLQLCEKYKIIFCDHPTMGTLEQSIYFGMAQQEREYISQRTKAALSALKSKGVKLGAQMLYVSAGIGGSFPFRLGAWPEMTVITLKRKL